MTGTSGGFLKCFKTFVMYWLHSGGGTNCPSRTLSNACWWTPSSPKISHKGIVRQGEWSTILLQQDKPVPILVLLCTLISCWHLPLGHSQSRAGSATSTSLTQILLGELCVLYAPSSSIVSRGWLFSYWCPELVLQSVVQSKYHDCLGHFYADGISNMLSAIPLLMSLQGDAPHSGCVSNHLFWSYSAAQRNPPNICFLWNKHLSSKVLNILP